METKQILLEDLGGGWSVAQVDSLSAIDWNTDFAFVMKTDEEISLVCRQRELPMQTRQHQDGWRMLRICGILDFGLVGILADLAGVLKAQQIPIFVCSSWNTDYVLFDQKYTHHAFEALKQAGYGIKSFVPNV